MPGSYKDYDINSPYSDERAIAAEHKDEVAAKNKKVWERDNAKINSPLSNARAHLEKESERGEHSPKIAGHKTSQHGGRMPENNRKMTYKDWQNTQDIGGGELDHADG